MSGYQHILCAVDLGGENLAVASRAVELARQYDSKLSLLHVVEYIPIDLANELVLPQQQDIEDQLVKRSRKALTKLASRLEFEPISENVVSGSTKAEIIEFTKASKVDLIVIGQHGRHGFSRLLGSTANAVLHHAPCDVMAVRIDS
jgi:universal stress protein A